MLTGKLNNLQKSGDVTGTLWREYLRYGLTVLKAAVAAVLISVLLLLLSALILLVCGVDDSATVYIVQAVRILSICFAGLVCGRSVPKMGWLAGIAAGLCYMLITVLSGLVFFGTPGEDGGLVADVIVAAVAGFASGVAGINTARKRRRK